jgi:hypothetical protein
MNKARVQRLADGRTFVPFVLVRLPYKRRGRIATHAEAEVAQTSTKPAKIRIVRDY